MTKFSLPLSKYFSLLSKYLKPYRKRVVILSLVIASRILFQSITPQIMRFYIDTGLSEKDYSFNLLFIVAIIFILIALLNQALRIYSVYVSENLAWDANNQLRFDLMEHCVNLDMSFHNEKKPGEMIERIDGDILTMSNFFSILVVEFAANILMILIVLGIVFGENTFMGIIFVIFTLVSFVIMYVVSKLAIPYWKDARENSSKMYGVIEEQISGIEDIKANGAQDYSMKVFHESAKGVYTGYAKAAIVSSSVRLGIFTIAGAGFTLIYAIGVPLYQNNEITIGTLLMFDYYIALLFGPIFNLLFQMQELNQAGAAIDRVSELFQVETKILDTGELIVFDEIAKMSFRNVMFSYKENELVLKGLSFDLEPKRVIGLVGATGSGKSTIARLMFRLYEPQKGEILLNEENIQNYSLQELRHQVTLVTQQVQLYRASVRDNVRLFNKSISDEQIIEVLKLVGLDTWLSQREEGLDTEILSDNSGLSSGEAQLLALSRIFLKDPKIVILDEASSRLDPVTEKMVDKSVEKLYQNRGGIIIAHRLETLQKVDDIMIIQSGEVVEFGPRDALVADPESKFSKLLHTGIQEVLV